MPKGGRRDPTRQIEALGLAVWRRPGPAAAMPVPHRHADLELNYALAGHFRYLIGGRVVAVPPGRLCALWGAAAHQTIAGPDDAYWATVPLEKVLGWGLPEPFLQRLWTDGLALDAEARPSDRERFDQWDRDLAAGEEGRRIVELEVEARLRRLARSVAGPEPWREEPSTGTAEAVRRMAAFIAAHYREPIDAAAVARAARMHPNHAMTCFRRHTGLTIRAAITRERVAHAQRRLATSSDPVGEIGFESGFGSTSRFHEAFRRETDTTPRRFRRQMRAGP